MNATTLRRHTWGWRLILVLGWAAVAVLFATSRGWEPQNIDPLMPPFERPSSAAALPDKTKVAELYGVPLVKIVSRPPDSKVFTSAGPLLIDYRHGAVESAWWEGWEDPASFGRMEVMVWQSTRASLPTPLHCVPAVPWNLSGAVAAGITREQNMTSEVCVLVKRGATLLQANALLLGDARDERGRRLAEGLVSHWVAEVSDAVPSVQRPMPPTNSQRSIRLAALVTLTLTGAMATVPSLLADRSTWRRLTSVLRRRNVHPTQLDIEPEARLALARSGALGIARFALVLAALRLGEELQFGLEASVVAIAGAYLAGVIGQRFVLPRSMRPQPARLLRGSSLAWTLAGTVVAVVVALSAGWLWTVGVTAGSAGVGRMDEPDWQAERSAIVYRVVAMWVFAAAVVPLAVGRRFARQTAIPVASPGPPTLLLRNFTDDSLTLRARRLDRTSLVDHVLMRRREAFEEVVAFSLGKHGHPFAVGRPGEALPPGLGATRLYYRDEHWRPAVRQIAGDASLVGIIVGRSHWLAWEMGLLLHEGLLHKTVFVLPPVSPREARKRLAVLRHVLNVPWSALETRGTGRDVLAVCWPLGRRAPVAVVSAAGDDLSYLLALDRCADMLTEPSMTDEVASTDTKVSPGSKASQPPLESDGSAPAVEMLAPGKSKAVRRWWQRPWLILLLLNVLVAPFLLPWTRGEPMAGEGWQVYAPTKGWVLLLDAGPDRVTYLRDGQTIIEQPMTRRDPGPAVELASLPGRAIGARLADGVVYAQVRVDGAFGFELVALRLADQVVLWRTAWSPYVRGWALTPAHLVVADSARGRIVTFDRVTGSPGRTVSMPCRPWSVTTTGAAVWVTCPETDRVARMDANLPGNLQTLAAPPGTTDVLGHGDYAWLLSPLESRLVLVDGSTNSQFWLPKAAPMSGASGGTLAVEGLERITIIGENGWIYRRLTVGKVGSLVVGSTGEVAFTDDRGIVLTGPAR